MNNYAQQKIEFARQSAAYLIEHARFDALRSLFLLDSSTQRAVSEALGEALSPGARIVCAAPSPESPIISGGPLATNCVYTIVTVQMNKLSMAHRSRIWLFRPTGELCCIELIDLLARLASIIPCTDNNNNNKAPVEKIKPTIVSINAQVHPPGLFPPGSKTIWRLYKQSKEDQAMRHSVPGKWICCLTDRSLGDVFLPEQLERLCLTYELEDVSAIPECDEGGSGWVSCYEETSSILWNVIFQAGRRLPSGPLVALAGNALPTHPESRSAVMRWFKDAWIKTDRPPEVADMITHALIDLRADGMLCFDSANGPDRLGVYMNTCMRLSSTNDLLRDCQGIEYILRETTSQGEGSLTPAELAILGHPTEHIGLGIILPSRPACRHQGRVSEMCESDLVSGVDSTRYLLWAGNLSDSYAIFQVEACFKSDGVWLVSLAGQVRGSTDLINLQMHIIANKHSQSIRQWYETACKDRREEDMGRFSFLVPFSAIYSPTGSPHWKSARCMHEALAFLHDHHNERFWKPANDTTALPHQR